MELHAENSAHDYHQACGHTEQASGREKSATLMTHCLLGDTPLSQHPEVASVVKLDAIANVTHENWQKLFGVFNIVISSNQWGDAPPPPPPPSHNLNAIGLPPD